MEAVKDQFRKSDKAGLGRISEDALAELIRRLCGEAVPLEVIRALFQSFDGKGGSRNGINYIEFIEWLFQSLENAGGAPSAVAQSLTPAAAAPVSVPVTTQIIPLDAEKTQQCRLFLTHQHTEECRTKRLEWLANGQEHVVKASTPPFNIRLKDVGLPPNCVSLNIATFGVKLPRVIMQLFENDELKRLSQESKIPIPRYSLDTFVQKKMAKVFDLAAEARKPEMGLDAKNLAAVDKMEAFAKEFGKLDSPDGTKISGPDDFSDFVTKHVPQGWEDNLHFDVLLPSNFGFDKDISDKLRQATIPVMEKDKEVQVSLEHHALRWLGKAFKGFGPVGCLTDLVNLVYAMLHYEQPAEASENAAIEAVNEIKDRLSKRSFDNLWIPTHLVHDAESDDCLCWLLLEHIHKLMGTELQVLIQLPQDEKLDDVFDLFCSKSRPRVQVFRDKDSANNKAVAGVWSKIAQAAKAETSAP